MRLGGAAGGRGEKPSDVLGVCEDGTSGGGRDPPTPCLRQAEERPCTATQGTPNRTHNH